MPRSSKDLAKRLRFDRFPRPDFFRRRYGAAAAVAAVAGLVIWAVLEATLGGEQYLPGPVSAGHATFGDRCERCHESFRGARDEKCLECHAARVHSEHEHAAPPCARCHAEHHAGGVLDVGALACTSCHADLRSKREPPAIEAAVDSFAAHPEFGYLRGAGTDAAKIRFNHRIHLTSGEIREKLECRSCHVEQGDGRLIEPIVFETHCRECHEQKVAELPYPISDVEAPHEEPESVRREVSARLVAVAVENPEAIFAQPEMRLPGRAARAAIDESKTLLEFRDKWTEKVEAMLYRPFVDAAPLLESNKYCFLCHFQDGTRATGELAEVVPPEIPTRWLEHATFSHRRHEQLACEACHGRDDGGGRRTMESSSNTGDVNLPGKEICQRCHADDSSRSAGARCALCHLYHDTSKDPEKRRAGQKGLSLSDLAGDPGL